MTSLSEYIIKGLEQLKQQLEIDEYGNDTKGYMSSDDIKDYIRYVIDMETGNSDKFIISSDRLESNKAHIEYRDTSWEKANTDDDNIDKYNVRIIIDDFKELNDYASERSYIVVNDGECFIDSDYVFYPNKKSLHIVAEDVDKRKVRLLNDTDKYDILFSHNNTYSTRISGIEQCIKEGLLVGELNKEDLSSYKNYLDDIVAKIDETTAEHHYIRKILMPHLSKLERKLSSKDDKISKGMLIATFPDLMHILDNKNLIKNYLKYNYTGGKITKGILPRYNELSEAKYILEDILKIDLVNVQSYLMDLKKYFELECNTRMMHHIKIQLNYLNSIHKK